MGSQRVGHDWATKPISFYSSLGVLFRVHSTRATMQWGDWEKPWPWVKRLSWVLALLFTEWPWISFITTEACNFLNHQKGLVRPALGISWKYCENWVDVHETSVITSVTSLPLPLTLDMSWTLKWVFLLLVLTRTYNRWLVSMKVIYIRNVLKVYFIYFFPQGNLCALCDRIFIHL